MRFRRSLLTAALATTLFAESVQRDPRVCDPFGNCRVYLSRRPVTVIAQQTAVWCWAASLAMLFDYYGHPVQQSRIVSRYFLAPIPVTGPPWILTQALNTTWTDDNGREFRVRSRITDRYTGSLFQVSDNDVLNALAADQPVFYADATHAMILVQADYTATPFGPNVRAGWAIDPWPLSLGFRQLQPHELLATYLAIATVEDIAPAAPVVNDIVSSASFERGLSSHSFGTIFGRDLSASGRTTTWDTAINGASLPFSLAGTSVTVDGRPAPVSYVSPTQINFIVPEVPSLGSVSVRVTTSNGTTNAAAVMYRRKPAFFTLRSNNRNFAIASIGNTRTLAAPAGAVPGQSRPARRGETLVLYANGLGPTIPAPPVGRILSAPFPVIADPANITIYFDQIAVRPTYTGMTIAGVFQINVQVPANTRTGEIPIRIQADGETSPLQVFTAIDPL